MAAATSTTTKFKTTAEAEAAYAALSEKLANMEAAYSADKAQAIDAVIKKYEAEARKGLGPSNSNPGQDREPTETKLADGTVRMDY